MQKITPFLWFENQAEEAARYYVSIFSKYAGGNSKMGTVARYDEAAAKASGQTAGSVMVATFELQGTQFTALNGGPIFKFNESVSFVVNCDSQEEVDYYWNALSAGGDPKAQQCGWLKDKYGLSWQVVPTVIFALMGDKNRTKAARVMEAILQMRKIDLKTVQDAYDKG